MSFLKTFFTVLALTSSVTSELVAQDKPSENVKENQLEKINESDVKKFYQANIEKNSPKLTSQTLVNQLKVTNTKLTKSLTNEQYKKIQLSTKLKFLHTRHIRFDQSKSELLIKLYKQIIKEDKSKIIANVAKYNLAEYYQEKKRPQESISLFQECLASKENNTLIPRSTIWSGYLAVINDNPDLVNFKGAVTGKLKLNGMLSTENVVIKLTHNSGKTFNGYKVEFSEGSYTISNVLPGSYILAVTSRVTGQKEELINTKLNVEKLVNLDLNLRYIDLVSPANNISISPKSDITFNWSAPSLDKVYIYSVLLTDVTDTSSNNNILLKKRTKPEDTTLVLKGNDSFFKVGHTYNWQVTASSKKDIEKGKSTVVSVVNTFKINDKK